MGVAFSLLTALLFASANIFSRRASSRTAGSDAIAVTLGFNLVIFGPILLGIKLYLGTPWPTGTALLLYALAGVFGSYLGRWWLYESISRMGPSRASLVKNSSPMFVVALALVAFGAVPSELPLLGILLIVAGMAALGLSTDRRRHGPTSRGLLYGVGAALSFAVSDVVRAASVIEHRDIVVATLVSVAGGWVAMAAVGRQGIGSHVRLLRTAHRDLLAASVLMGAAQLTLFVAVSHMFVAYVTALVATAPLLTSALSAMFVAGDERFGRVFWCASTLVLAGGVVVILFR
ncbi:DMT family transporter [Qaidamihabitans albus]|uniref:DMT family transporter n=1 Tax=Qaidamihabitans albus TaxID=2795733 RepID=UPI0018F19FDD|nr:DMT family transporter [Qaidamihabitans albus]